MPTAVSPYVFFHYRQSPPEVVYREIPDGDRRLVRFWLHDGQTPLHLLVELDLDEPINGQFAVRPVTAYRGHPNHPLTQAIDVSGRNLIVPGWHDMLLADARGYFAGYWPELIVPVAAPVC